MALAPLSPLHIYSDLTDTKIGTVRNIQGKPVLAECMVNEYEAMKNNLFDAEIKLKLCNEIAAQLYKENMIEFTKELSITGEIRCRARIFAVPNTDVQLLREQGII